MRFKISVNRLRSCPGIITDVYQQQRDDTRAQIIRERSIVTTEVRNTPVLEFNVMPPEIRPGVWHLISSLVSVCPGIFMPTRHVDVITDFDFEIEE